MFAVYENKLFLLQVNVRTSAIYRIAGGRSFNYRICSNTFGITTPRWNGRRTGRSIATSAAKASPQNPAFVPTRRRSVMYVPNPTSNNNRHFGYLTRCSHTIIIEPWSERSGEPSRLSRKKSISDGCTHVRYVTRTLPILYKLNALLSLT